MKRFIFSVAILFILPFAYSQEVTYATATVAIGGNTWGGVVVPGGLRSGGTTLFDGMNQQATIPPFCPTWIGLWNTAGPGPGIADGQFLSWTIDVPQGPGHYHVVYNGTFHVDWWFGMYRTYSISYGVAVDYVFDD